MQVCRSWIAQVEYQGQTLSTRILDCKPVINTNYSIGHRLELPSWIFALCTFFCSMLNVKSQNNLYGVSTLLRSVGNTKIEVSTVAAESWYRPSSTRQWLEVSVFLACISRMAMCFLTCSTCIKVWQKSYTLGHCRSSTRLLQSSAHVSKWEELANLSEMIQCYSDGGYLISSSIIYSAYQGNSTFGCKAQLMSPS